MDIKKIKCQCFGEFTESDFRNHYKNCPTFSSYFSDFEEKIENLIRVYSKSSDNMLIMIVLFKVYISSLEENINRQ